MARTKQTARKSTGGKRPRAQLPLASPSPPPSPIRALVNRAFDEIEPKTRMRTLRRPASVDAEPDTRVDVGGGGGGGEGSATAADGGGAVSSIASRAFSQGPPWPLNVLRYLDPVDLTRSASVCRSFRDAMKTAEADRALLASVFGYFAVAEEYADGVADLAKENGRWGAFSRLLVRMAFRLRELYDPFEVPLVHRALLAENAARRLVRSASPLWAADSKFYGDDDDVYDVLWDTESKAEGEILSPTWENCVDTKWNGNCRHGGVVTSWTLFLGDLPSADFGNDAAWPYLKNMLAYLQRLAPSVPPLGTTPEFLARAGSGGPKNCKSTHPGYAYFLLDSKEGGTCDGESWPDVCAREGIPANISLNSGRGSFTRLPLPPGQHSPDYVVYEQIHEPEVGKLVEDHEILIRKEDPVNGDHHFEELTGTDPLQRANLDAFHGVKFFCNRKWDLSKNGKLRSNGDLLLRVRKDWHTFLSPQQWEMVRQGTPAPFIMFGKDSSAEPEEFAVLVQENGEQEVGNWSSYYSGCDRESGIVCSVPFDSSHLSCDGGDHWPWRNRGLLAFCFGFLSGHMELDDGALLAWSLWSALHGIEPFYSDLKADWRQLVKDYEESEDPRTQSSSGVAGVARIVPGAFEVATFRNRMLYLKHLVDQKLADPEKYCS